MYRRRGQNENVVPSNSWSSSLLNSQRFRSFAEPVLSYPPMLHTDGIKPIRRVPWHSLPTGGIVLAGVEIDG